MFNHEGIPTCGISLDTFSFIFLDEEIYFVEHILHLILERELDRGQKPSCFLSLSLCIYIHTYMKARDYACQSKSEGKNPKVLLKKNTHRLV